MGKDESYSVESVFNPAGKALKILLAEILQEKINLDIVLKD